MCVSSKDSTPQAHYKVYRSVGRDATPTKFRRENMYVSIYNETFDKAIENSIEQMPDRVVDLAKTMTDAIFDRVWTNLEEYILNDMKANLDSNLKNAAAKIAESMLMNALAGDDKEIRNLFGFSDYYMRHMYIGNLPTQWSLITAIVKSNPDLFKDERLNQLQALYDNQNKENQRLHQYIDMLKKQINGETYE